MQLGSNDIVTPGTRLRCYWEVQAGVIPGTVEGLYTRRWMISSEAWAADVQAAKALGQAEGPLYSHFRDFQTQAQEYAASITDPRTLNWVTVSWMWM